MDSEGNLELNSSSGAISIGSDAVAQSINIGTGAAPRTISVGSDITTKVDVNANSIELDAGTTVTINSDDTLAMVGTDVDVDADDGTLSLDGSDIDIGTAEDVSVDINAMTLDIDVRDDITLDSAQGTVSIDGYEGVNLASTGVRTTVRGRLNVDEAVTLDSTLDVTGGLALAGVAVTSTAAELNVMDGVTVSTSEINYLQGVTSSLQDQINSLTDQINAIESLTTEQVQDIIGAMVSGNTESKIAVTYDDDNAKLDFSVDVTSPSITGAQIVNVNEGDTAVDTYSASEPVTWSISGDDSSIFSFNDDTGALEFSTEPNYEAPTDADEDNVYVLTLTATDAAGNASSVNINVTVVNVVEAFDPSAFSIQATVTTTTTATINWTYSGEGVDGYFLWVRIGRGGSWNPVTVFKQNIPDSAGLTSYTVGGLTPGTMYAFRLWPIYNDAVYCNNCNGTGEPLFTTQQPEVF